MESDPTNGALATQSSPTKDGSQQSPAVGSDGTLKTLEDEYARLRADLNALASEIKQIRGLRVEELAKSIKKRRYRLLQLEEQIFRKRQLNLFPDPPILRPKRRRSLKTNESIDSNLEA